MQLTFQSMARCFVVGFALPCVAACSLQNFDYLKGGTGAGGAAGTSTDTGGNGNGGSNVDTGSGGTNAGSGGDVGGAGGSAGDATEAGLANDASAADPNETSASIDARLDVTQRSDGGASVLVNSGFENGYAGWSFDPPAAMGKYAYTQVAGAGSVTIDGQNELATWSGTDAFTVRVFQSFSNLPDGQYTFSGYFNRGDGQNHAYVYAKDCGSPDRQQDISLTAPTQWIATSIGAIQVAGGHCEVGFFVDANPTNWLNADAFSFALDPQ